MSDPSVNHQPRSRRWPTCVDFYHVDSMETINYLPIYRLLPDAALVAAPVGGWFDVPRAVAQFAELGVPYRSTPSPAAACLITTQDSFFQQYQRHWRQYRRSLKVRLMYSLAEKGDQNHSRRVNRPFDAVLSPGEYSRRQIARHARTVVVGFPKYDAFFRGEYRRAEQRTKLGLDPVRPCLLYAPTWSKHSSTEKFAGAIRDLARSGAFQVLFKPHTVSVRFERERIECFREEIEAGTVVCIEKQTGLGELFPAADVVLADDMSGACWEAVLVTGLPTVALQVNPQLPRNHLDRRISELAPVCDRPEDLPRAIDRAAADLDRLRERRLALADEMLSHRDGTAARRAADAVLELLDDDRRHPTRAVFRQWKWHRHRMLTALGGWVGHLCHPVRTAKKVARRLLGDRPVVKTRRRLPDGRGTTPQRTGGD
jgi:hypothetical protein